MIIIYYHWDSKFGKSIDVEHVLKNLKTKITIRKFFWFFLSIYLLIVITKYPNEKLYNRTRIGIKKEKNSSKYTNNNGKVIIVTIKAYLINYCYYI